MVMPEGDTGDDVEQWLDQGGQGRVIEMLKTAKPAPKPDPDPEKKKPAGKKPAEPPPPLRTDEIDGNRHFQVLGNVNDAVAIMLSSYRVFLLSRTSLTQPSTLISLADYHWWLSVTGRDALSGPTAQQIGSVLLRSADRHGQLNPSKFLGRGCFKYDGAKVAWHLGDRLLVEGKTLGLGELPGVVPIGGPPIEVADEPATVAQRRAVADAVLAYRFESEFDGRRFLAWIVAAAIGGALGWRPHAWMSAPAGVGKSWLLDTVLTPLLGDGDLLLRTDDPTAAGLARAAQSDAIAVAFDEAESNRQQIDGVLDLARVASGGSGSRIRADMGSGGYNVLRPRFSLLMSSITVARLTQANATRFVTIRLSPQDVADWPAVKRGIEKALQAAPGLRAAIVRDAAQIVASAEQFNQALIEGGTPSRRASIEAALGAAWEWWSGPARRGVGGRRAGRWRGGHRCLRRSGPPALHPRPPHPRRPRRQVHRARVARERHRPAGSRLRTPQVQGRPVDRSAAPVAAVDGRAWTAVEQRGHPTDAAAAQWRRAGAARDQLRRVEGAGRHRAAGGLQRGWPQHLRRRGERRPAARRGYVETPATHSQ